MKPYVFVNGRGERIRTSDLSIPNRALYQTEPRPADQTMSLFDSVVRVNLGYRFLTDSLFSKSML